MLQLIIGLDESLLAVYMFPIFTEENRTLLAAL